MHEQNVTTKCTNNFKRRNKEKKGELDKIKDERIIVLTQGNMAEF